MSQDRISAPAIISIEKDIVVEISIYNVIDQFASSRNRRMQFFQIYF